MSEPTLVDVTGGLDGYRVYIGNRLYGEFATLSNAARVASYIHALRNLPPMPPIDVAGELFNRRIGATL